MKEIESTINSLKQGYGVVVIYPYSHKEKRCKIFCDGCRISESNFDWKLIDSKREREECGTPYCLTLNDISGQWYKKHKTGILTVVVESLNDGNIYQIGRHNNTIWEKHGVTNGFA